MSSFSNNTDNVTTTVAPDPSNHDFQDELKFLIVPLVVIGLVMLLAALVYKMAKRRRLDTLRNNLLSLYDFDSNEQEWESLNSYDNPNYTNYSTTTF